MSQLLSTAIIKVECLLTIKHTPLLTKVINTQNLLLLLILPHFTIIYAVGISYDYCIFVVEILYYVATVYLLPTLHLRMPYWQLKMSHGGSIYTTEKGKC